VAIVTGSSVYQELFQGLLAERASANGEDTLVPVMKLTDDTTIFINQLNDLIPSAYDYVDLTYTGNNLTTAVFKTGGAGGVTVATINITYDINDNIKTVART
jgi:hypothetical protein